MRNFDETNITAAVLEKVRQGTDQRVTEISDALVRHLHAFVREIEPTQAEWTSAIAFLTRTGQMCDATRQEFILLSDALGVSMLVDAINHRLPGNATETTVLGPFYHDGAPEHALGADISNGMAGEPLLVEGSVTFTDGEPIAGAVVDSWHTDGDGYYDVQGPADLRNIAGRARFRTDEHGRFWFRSIVPASYPIPDDGPVGDMLKAQGRHPYRPAHVHFMVSHPRCETLVTHVFLHGDQYLDSDVVFGVKDSLIQRLEHQDAGPTQRGNWTEIPTAALRYDFVLAPKLGPGLPHERRSISEESPPGHKKWRDMGAQRFAPEQIIAMLSDVDAIIDRGSTAAQACRQIGITEQTLQRWRKEYGGLKVDQVRRMTDLERENARLKTLVADLALDKAILQEASTPDF